MTSAANLETAKPDANGAPEEDFVCLKSDVVHVIGARRSAIYDLRKERIYWLDEAGRNAVCRLISGLPLKAVLNDAECFEILKKLQMLDLVVLEGSPRGEKISAPQQAQRKPRLAWIELGTLCNHKCFHCYNSSGPQEATGRNLERETLFRAVDEIAQNGVHSLKLIGGEPFVHFELVVDLLARARGRGITHLSVHTNGTLLTKARAQRLSELNIRGQCDRLRPQKLRSTRV